MNIFKNLYFPLIIFSVLIALASNFGSIIAMIEPFTFTKIIISNQDNQWWRLITPMFIHFSFAHLAFNCLWVYILGEKIEQVDGSFIFFLIVVFSSIFSNFLQFYWTDLSLFGGLSGVIYGLIGYCMILEMDSEYDRYQLPPALYLFMIIWLILGFMGLLDLFGFGSVANFAHLGGLVSGVIFAMICKTILKRT